MVPQARLILSFDFDGTLHHPGSVPPVPDAFFELIRDLRETHQAVWGINTGRSLEQMYECFEESRFPFMPDWLIGREREIYFSDPVVGWRAHEAWNERCERAVHELFADAREMMARVRSEIEEHTGARWMSMEGEPAGLISQSEEEMAWIVERITPMVASEPRLSWQRNSIYLRFGHRDLQKGSSLAEVAKCYGLTGQDAFAIGDSHNDVEMLDVRYSRYAACPSNAVAEIKAVISERGGYQAQAGYGHGAVEALRHYFVKA